MKNHLKVKHVIVCGHYGCGGVQAAMQNKSLGLINKWVRNIKEVYKDNKTELKKIDDDKKTKSGLVLSDDVIERPTKGKVLDIGEGRMNEDGVILPMKIKKDDIILYPKYAGHSVKIDSEELLILDEKEVLAVLKEEF